MEHDKKFLLADKKDGQIMFQILNADCDIQKCVCEDTWKKDTTKK